MKLSSDAIQVEGAGTAPSETSTAPSETSTAPSESNIINITSTAPCLRESYSLYLIKAHGLLISNHPQCYIQLIIIIQGASCVWHGGCLLQLVYSLQCFTKSSGQMENGSM